MRNYFFINIIFLLVSFSLYGRMNENISDSSIVDTYVKQANRYRFSNPDSALLLIDSAIELSRKTGLNKRFVSSYRTKGVLYILRGKLDKAIQVYDTAIVLAKKYEFNDILIKIYINLGIVYTQKGEYDEADYYYSKVLNDFEISLNQKSVLYNNMGLMYSAKGDYLESMEYHQKALANRELMHDSLGAASSIMNIANIHFYQKNYSKAITYYKNAASVFDKKHYSYGSGQCYHNLGTIYEKIDSLEKAEFFLRKALNLESAKTKRGRAKTLNMLGLVSMKEKKFTDAEKFFIESLNIRRKVKSKSQIIPTLNNLADLYNQMGMPNKANKYNIEAIELSKESGSREFEKEAFFTYSQSLELIGNYKKSLFYYKEYSELKDSLLDKEKYSRIQELEIKYNSALQERKLEQQKAELIQKDLESNRKDAIIKKEQIQKYAVGSIAFLILAILLIELRNLRNKRKTALLLVEKNEELNNQRIAELIKKHQLESAKNSLTAQEKERNRIAQELHDGIGGSLAAIKLYVDSLRKSYKIDELNLVHDNINKTYEEVRTLSHNLTPPEFEFASITDIVKAYINQISAHSKTEIILSAIPQTGWNDLDESVQINIYRVAQELINNILKHAKASRIEFNLELIGGVIHILVRDNGVGFDTSKRINGIGLKNIQSRVEEFNGDFSIKSVLGKGTTVVIKILDPSKV
ncbi:MAG: hypothetical protein DRI86_12905 [Bacteroidetes bacterium]|nr:MAG: hypothetical protein DRI86_12905 [Bacteroidota bacterium]